MVFPLLLTLSWPYPAARPGHPESRLACKPAFSLVELMIVLAIMALIAGIVVPNLQRNFERNQVRDASRLLQEKIGELKMQASRTGQPVLLQFGWESNQLRIWNLPAAASTASDGLANDNADSSFSTTTSTLDATRLDSGLPDSYTESLWQSEDWVLPAEIYFRSKASDPESQDSSGTTLEPTMDSDLSEPAPEPNENDGTVGSPQWSAPLVITGQGFSRDRLIWLETEKLQCPLLLRSVSGQIQTGRVRAIQNAPLPTESESGSAREFTSELEGSRL